MQGRDRPWHSPRGGFPALSAYRIGASGWGEGAGVDPNDPSLRWQERVSLGIPCVGRHFAQLKPGESIMVLWYGSRPRCLWYAATEAASERGPRSH